MKISLIRPIPNDVMQTAVFLEVSRSRIASERGGGRDFFPVRAFQLPIVSRPAGGHLAHGVTVGQTDADDSVPKNGKRLLLQLPISSACIKVARIIRGSVIANPGTSRSAPAIHSLLKVGSTAPPHSLHAPTPRNGVLQRRRCHRRRHRLRLPLGHQRGSRELHRCRLTS